MLTIHVLYPYAPPIHYRHLQCLFHNANVKPNRFLSLLHNLPLPLNSRVPPRIPVSKPTHWRLSFCLHPPQRDVQTPRIISLRLRIPCSFDVKDQPRPRRIDLH
jgi:hypothetical protein